MQIMKGLEVGDCSSLEEAIDLKEICWSKEGDIYRMGGDSSPSDESFKLTDGNGTIT